MDNKNMLSDEELDKVSDEELEKVTGGADNADNDKQCARYGVCICTIARQVIKGNWGCGEERKRRLREAGYDYGLVQSVVEKMLADPTRHQWDCFL